MTWFTKWAFNNKAAVSLLVILSLAFGALSYHLIPRELFPSADQPMMTVIVMGEGADAKTMEEQVTEPIEHALGTVKGKRNIFSISADGYSKVDVVIDASTEIKEAKAEVQEIIDGLSLPEGYSKPVVSQLNVDQAPLWQIGLIVPNGITNDVLKKMEQDVVPKFQGISGISNVSVYGKKEKQVMIKLNKNKLAEKQIPFQTLLGILQGKNISVAVGEENIDDKMANIKVIGEVEGKEFLEDVQITPDTKLKDIATIEVANSNDDTFLTHINGKEAVVLLAFKEASANAVAIGEKIDEAIEDVNKSFDATVIKASLIISFSEFITNSVDSTIYSVLLGALFATIVILLFFRNIRMTIVTITSIPLSLALTLILLHQSGITLNLLTIGAVAVAVGRLVDDSIVVIENIFRKSQLGELSKKSIIEATREVAAAITSSTLTTVAVFLPMGFVQSLKELVLPFALTVTYSLMSSLLVALIVVPMMSGKMIKPDKVPKYKKPHTYIRILRWSLNHKWLPLVLVSLIFIGSLVTYAIMPKGTVDAADNDIAISMEYPNDTPFQEVKNDGLALEKWLLQQSGVKDVILLLGSNEEDAQWGQVSSPNNIELHVTMKDGANTEALMKNVEAKKKQYAEAEMNVFLLSMTASGSSTIEIDVIGNHVKDLIETAEKVTNSIKEIDGIEKVTSNQQELKPVYQVVVNPKKANPEEVGKYMQSMLNPVPLGKIKMADDEANVFLDSGINITSQSDLKKIKIDVNNQSVPVSSIATIEKSEQATSILRKNGEEYIRIEAKADPKKLSVVSQMIAAKTKEIDLPDHVTLSIGGAGEEQAEQFNELLLVMLISIAIVYLIMVMTFKTLRAPLAILFTLPLALIGAILGLLISGLPIDIGAMIGALMLIGIVVTNAIVLIDRVKQNEKTMTIREALLEAGAIRLRPIIMTALSTIGAMTPLLFGKEEMGALVSKGLAVVVIGGLSVSTILTLVIVPIIYELLHFKKAKKQRIAKQNELPV